RMTTDELPTPIRLAFAPLHKAAFGVACGTAMGAVICLFTLVGARPHAPDESPLRLLSEYFAGYSVTPLGSIIGLAWGFVTGFVVGWFIAFVRNLTLAASVFWLRTRAELTATRDFLDHI
ncbi:MAG: hypothetical protein ACREPM_04785, partial [Gemmatimonadaceae bacterium]